MEQNGENASSRLTNLETDVERVVQMLKENKESTDNRYKEMTDLLKKMYDENKKSNEEVAKLKSLITSSQGPIPGSSGL